jgi:hypothetical protein
MVEFWIEELQFQPGRYFLDVGARSRDSKMLDFLQGFAQIDVPSEPETPIVITERSESGSVRVPASFRHQPAELSESSSDFAAGEA